MAVEYNDQNRGSRRATDEPEDVQLLLAKAYFLNKKYSTAINITSKLKESRQIKIAYEATFL